MKSMCINMEGVKVPRAPSVKEKSDQSEVVALVNRASGGDIESFGNLYNIYLDRIYRYVYYHVKDRMMAEDITEDVFIKAWKAIKSCKGRERTFSSWIYRIAHNQMVNTQRNNNRSISMGMKTLVDASDHEQRVDDKLDEYELAEMLGCLPPAQKQVIIFKFIEGMANSEIAKIMNKSEGAIRILQMRALSALRKEIGSGVI
jgi:RNA polymerase sigma-70 factor (ECF subfamily)